MSVTVTGEWVRRFHQSDESPFRLVCFPHAGGSASYYYSLSESLAGAMETVAVQYPGRQDRRAEPLVADLGELADHAYAALRPWTDRPLVLFGHSMGSVLAFEVALRLQDAGTPPTWLFTSGYPAPSRLRGGDVHLRDDAGIIRELREVGGIDPIWLDDEDLMGMVLPVLRNDYRAIETHPRTTATVDCPLTMLTGDTDPHTTAEEAKAWADHTTAAFALKTFPGGHFYLDDHAAELPAIISSAVSL
jgi:surfactin synthase thioesterase subunit